MSNVTHKFRQAMEDAAKIYGKRLDAKTVGIYANVLDGYDLDECASAIMDLCGSSAHFPKPYQIKELVTAQPTESSEQTAPLDDWRLQCESAWERLKRAILNGSKHFDFDDDLHAQKALDVDGFAEYRELKDKRDAVWTFAEHRFNRQYIRFCYADYLRNERAQK